MHPSELAEKFMVRLPGSLRQRIKVAAAQNHRSMNSEIVFHLERVFGDSEIAAGEGFADTAPAAQINSAA